MKNTFKIIERDPQLAPYEKDIKLRMDHFNETRKRLLGRKRKLASIANGHCYFGFHQEDGFWVFREWAPNAEAVFLFGEFNRWNKTSHPLEKLEGGIFEISVPGALPHGSKVRLRLEADHEIFERIPSYTKRAVQNPKTLAFDGQIWAPQKPYRWRCRKFVRNSREPLLIYECHIGIAGEEERVHTYKEFRQQVLPRVKRLGYNAVQLMAVMEHPHYGSFGYQVSSFFAVSSRFGTPEELKELIDEAHSMGISVLLDLVHSHAVRNEIEGLGRFDGTVRQYFHEGARGDHPQWGTKLFHYGKDEVLHFLLSNLKFWLTEYRFDGFRFDGVTSMLYHDHGIGSAFDHYKKYFSTNTDLEAVTYLKLASTLCREVKEDCVLIAEDMSGMPGMCLPVEEGGLGFDYRLGMGLPDFWIEMLKSRKDEDWDVQRLWHELSQRRPGEKVIGYCESHDQALVGDKTIMFWLADKEMYWHMDKASKSMAIDRAMSLHKMIRLITCTCAGEGYLNFMGNEFGHPEWIDFPREENGGSYHYARRQWSLAENGYLKYHYLEDFDQEMIRLVKEEGLLEQPACLRLLHHGTKTVVFSKGRLLFFFNFHPTQDFGGRFSLPQLAWLGELGKKESEELAASGTPEKGEAVLGTGWICFGGYKEKEHERFQIEKGQLTVHVDKRSALIIEI